MPMLVQAPLAELREFLVHLLCHARHGACRHIEATHFLEDAFDLAGRDPHEIHLRTRQQQRPLTALPPGIEPGRVGLGAPCLRHTQREFAYPRFEAPGLNADSSPDFVARR